MSKQLLPPSPAAPTASDLREAMKDAIAAFMLYPSTRPADLADAIYYAIEGVADGEGLTEERMDLYKDELMPRYDEAMSALNDLEDAEGGR